MTRYLLPDREEVEILDRPTEPGYLWVNHPKLGIIQMPDTPTNITPPEPDNNTIWLDPSGAIITRADHWAPDHAPECRWLATGERARMFWPDVCTIWDTRNWSELRTSWQPTTSDAIA